MLPDACKLSHSDRSSASSMPWFFSEVGPLEIFIKFRHAYPNQCYTQTWPIKPMQYANIRQLHWNSPLPMVSACAILKKRVERCNLEFRSLPAFCNIALGWSRSRRSDLSGAEQHARACSNHGKPALLGALRMEYGF